MGEGRARGSRRRPFDLGRFGRRGGYVGLIVLAGLVTVAVPPLIAPHRDRGPPAGSASSVSPSPPPASAADASTAPAADTGLPPPCAVPTSGTASARPSCAVYTATLGTGWRIDGVGVTLLPAGIVPGTQIVAIRVEPKEKVASVALVATVPVTVPDHGHLKLRVYGGRLHGTVLRLRMPRPTPSAPAASAGGSLVLNAPADRWTDFTVEVGELTGAGNRVVQRIDLEIATELVPNAYRFFLDDIEFVS